MTTHFPGMSKYASFARKLNRYGFKRVVGKGSFPSEIFVYNHMTFRKGITLEVANTIRIERKRKKNPVILNKQPQDEDSNPTAIAALLNGCLGQVPNNVSDVPAVHCHRSGQGRPHHPHTINHGAPKMCTSPAVQSHQDNVTALSQLRSALAALLLQRAMASTHNHDGMHSHSASSDPRRPSGSWPSEAPNWGNNIHPNLFELSALKQIFSFLVFGNRGAK